MKRSETKRSEIGLGFNGAKRGAVDIAGGMSGTEFF